MNIEIANRLFELRKKNALSQEGLADRIGVSRQAVSKWERAESSPDTDNLIQLAKLYEMSLDELLFTTEPVGKNETGQDGETDAKPADQVSIGRDGIHISDKDGTEVHIDMAGVRVEVKDETDVSVAIAPVLPIIIVGAYLVLGFVFDLWHPGWLIFFAIPIFYEFVAMAEAEGACKKANLFPMALFCVVAFLLLGFLRDLWHPAWLLFLLIPIYHSIATAAAKNAEARRRQ